MSGIQQQLLGGPFGVAAYQIQRSLRFNSADSAYLNRTLSAGNRKTWTWSGWVKRSAFDTFSTIFCGNGGTSDATFTEILFRSDQFQINGYNTVWRRSTAVYRDPSAWYHLVVAFDTTQATASNRVKLYVNGTQVTDFAISNDPTQNTDYGINAAVTHGIGSIVTGEYYNGYMTDVYFIDGQALTPSSFGETNADTGVWQPKQYTGTYGTNGFYLNFSDNSGTTSTTLGKDYSGNGNNWTPNNFSVTAGVGNDSLVDSPTAYGTDTGAGGEVRGNYCTINALDTQLTLANGNLQFDRATTSWRSARATFGMSSGKWYWEVVATSASGTLNMMVGISTIAQSLGIYFGANPTGWGYNAADGNKYNDGNNLAYGNTFTTNDVIGISFDADSGDLKFYKNGTVQNSGTAAYTGLTSGPYFPTVALYGTATAYINFGQRPFAYTAPSGFKALVTQNLPTPTVIQGDDYFNTVLWTGNGASSRAITGVGFQPDWVWDKMRSDAYQHAIVDSVRGGNKVLHSNSTAAEDVNWTYGYVSSFDSDGFTIQAGSTSAENWNLNAATFVAWCWKANGTGSSNTQGTISSTVSANTTAGFSIVTYTGNGTSGATVGHGLGATPSLIIVKARSVAGEYWMTYHTSLGNTKAIFLQRTDAESTSSTYWNNTSPTSTLFSLGTNGSGNGNGTTYVAYCFAPVAGFSAFGSYTGNGSTDGPFIYTGFRPAWVMIKASSGSGSPGSQDWYVLDSKRDTYNLTGNKLFPNSSNSENASPNTSTTNALDFLSNGFKLKTSNDGTNNSSNTYIYAAFASNPFKYALAR